MTRDRPSLSARCARSREEDIGSLMEDRKSTRLNSSHTEIYTLSLHDALPIWSNMITGSIIVDDARQAVTQCTLRKVKGRRHWITHGRSEERRVGKECRSRCDWSSDVCSSDLEQYDNRVDNRG